MESERFTGKLAPVCLAVVIGTAAAAAPARKAARLPAKAARQAPPPKAPAPKLPPAPKLLTLRVVPETVELDGPRTERQLLVTGQFTDGSSRDLTDLAAYASSAARVAAIGEGGRLQAVGDGEAKVRVSVGKAQAWVRASVKGMAQPRPISFSNEVQPILTKAGCNQGACHGALAGKGRFRLSLLGYDPEADFPSVAQEYRRRRISLTDPARSLLLLKPTLGVPHLGGMRFKPGSYEYNTLLAWIRDGAPGPGKEDAAVTAVEVFPPHAQAKAENGRKSFVESVAIPQAKGPARLVKLPVGQRLTALARFSNGTTEDVTRKAQFRSLNDGVAQVDADGLVQLAASGETSVMVRYRGAAAVARFTAPYSAIRSFPAIPATNFIDTLVAAKWKELGLLPSPTCTDAEFIRRVYLDALGTLPKPEEVRAFLAECEAERKNGGVDERTGGGTEDKKNGSAARTSSTLPLLHSSTPKSRAALIDQVLARPEYTDYWALKWGDLLRNNSDKVQPKGMWSFYNWLRASLRENKSADKFTRELITAQGSAYTNGPANYFRIASSPADMAETTAQVFLGVRLTCARCHHHPFEKWTQDDYWQMAAFFSRVGLKGSQEFGLFGGEQVVRLNPSGEVSNPRTNKVMKPTPLDGVPVDDPVDRRRALAAWITRPENPLFARNIVNRYWGYLLGRGIVEPVDDMRVTNPPSNPELLDALAKDFTEHKFDLKHLLRTLMNSATYQLSSNPTPANRTDEVFFTKYAVKRMGAEEMLDALNFATGTMEKFPNLPAGMRAIQLPDPNIPHYFLDTFGRPARIITCECERSIEPNMAQALHLMNSDFVQNKVAAGDGRIAKLLAAKKTDEEITEELYLVTFSRLPTPDERTKAIATVAAAPSKKEGFEDLLWALMNSREFIFKH